MELGDGLGFWRSALDGLRLAAVGVLTSLLVLLSGFIPVVGGVAAPVLGIIASGRLLARELTSRAFDARGISGADRAALLRGSHAQLLGFGVATQLCFLVPLGAIVTMPAAVASARSQLAGTSWPCSRTIGPFTRSST